MVLVIATMFTSIPFMAKEVKADEARSTLSNLGNLGTVNIGQKSESGNWMQTKVGNVPVFCLDLGKTCHTGWTYVSTEKTIKSDSSNKSDALKAKIGYWYSVTKKGTTKAWVYAQSLIWGVEEGITSESGLKDIIKQVKNNTGYELFDVSNALSVEGIDFNAIMEGLSIVGIFIETYGEQKNG